MREAERKKASEKKKNTHTHARAFVLASHTLTGCMHVSAFGCRVTFVACANVSWHRWRVFS